MIHLSDVLAKLNKDRSAKAANKAANAAASAKAKGELAATKGDKAEAEQDLRDTKATFAAKTATFNANQALRKGELEALSKAIEIISSPSVADSYKEHINLAQVKGVSLLQTESRRQQNVARLQAAEYLRRRAKALSSKVLASFASQVAANPFEKVIGMIESLLEKLKAEAAAEAEHKAWCDEQLHENKLKRNRLTVAVNKLLAEIDEAAATIDTLAAEIDTLVTEQAELAKAMAEATKVRTEENAANTVTIADAEAGQVAVKDALATLREFYSSQAAFLQRQVPEMA